MTDEAIRKGLAGECVGCADGIEEAVRQAKRTGVVVLCRTCMPLVRGRGCEPGCLEPPGHVGAPHTCIAGPLPPAGPIDDAARRTSFSRVCRVEAAGDGLAKLMVQAVNSIEVARFPGPAWIAAAEKALALWKLERGDGK